MSRICLSKLNGATKRGGIRVWESVWKRVRERKRGERVGRVRESGQSERDVIMAEMQKSKSLSRFSSCRTHTHIHTHVQAHQVERTPSGGPGLLLLVPPLKGTRCWHKVNFNLTFIEQNSFIFINAPTTQRRKQETNINKCPSEERERMGENEKEREGVNRGTINKSVCVFVCGHNKKEKAQTQMQQRTTKQTQNSHRKKGQRAERMLERGGIIIKIHKQAMRSSPKRATGQRDKNPSNLQISQKTR